MKNLLINSFKIIIIFLFCGTIVSEPLNTIEHKFDKTSSNIFWEAYKASGSSHNGGIKLLDGSVTLSNDNKILGATMIIDMESINCSDINDPGANNSLVRHLKNEDFFAVSQFPTASLSLLKAYQIEESTNYNISADLTIRGITHPVQFSAEIIINNEGAYAKGIIPINRAIYNIKYKSISWYDTLGDHFIEDIFHITFDIVAPIN
tara:strand:+ start:38 stop:655 length:618 start_codon:yes stop_codon:yes gene_type:complete